MAKRNRRSKYINPANVKQAKAVKNPEYLSIDPYRDGLSASELEKVRMTLAKRANQRLVRLERSQSGVTGESYSEYGAAQLAYEYLRTTNKSGKLRYRESPMTDGDINQIRRDIVSMQTFLASQSSTVQGQKAIERKRIETFEKKGIRFANNKEFYDFLNSETFKSMKASGYSSEQIVEIYDMAREKGDNAEVVKQFNTALRAFRKGRIDNNFKNLTQIMGVNPLTRG